MLALSMLSSIIEAKPVGDARSWFASVDYPPSAMQAAETGDVVFQLEVGPEGDVRGCAIVRSTATSGLDAATCTHMTRMARFVPVRADAGMPAMGRYRGLIRWRLPDPGPPPAVLLMAKRGLPETMAGNPAGLTLSIDTMGLVADWRSRRACPISIAKVVNGCGSVGSCLATRASSPRSYRHASRSWSGSRYS